ncbi:MAG: hypothetical protein J5803_05695 [Desulfovibrio sp.]|nr:hypothetical protein [Desulfovibrio sp.]
MPELCILHANCQGEVLEKLLLFHPDFAARFTVRHVVNYTREPIEQETLDHTSLYLYQYLGPHFQEYASSVFLDRLPASCHSLCIPNLFFKGYWPFWTNSTQVIDFANTVLEDLFRRNLDPELLLSIYLKGKLPEFEKVCAIANDSLAREKEKERLQPIQYTHILEEHWRDEALFYTVNHPGIRLSCHVAQEVLRLLGFSPLPEAVLASFVHPFGDFCLPIHPEVGKRLNLRFTGIDVTYPIYGSRFTHRDFVINYLACRLHGVSNLPAFLHASSEKKHGLAVLSE